jgi:anaerobic magnesium-protoporphyrin IX monomethyl ester cyclase
MQPTGGDPLLDVLLIKPDFRNEIALMPPLGLCSLAAVLRENGLSVAIKDYALQPASDRRMASDINEFSPAVIGITATTPSIHSAISLARFIKEQNPDIHLCAGGVHASNRPEEMLQSGFESVCIGEAEYSFLELTKAIIKKKSVEDIPGVITKNTNKAVINSQWQHVEDLDKLPFPAIDLLPVDEYFRRKRTYGVITRSPRVLPILTTRGCPSRCTFCHSVTGNRIRYRSSQNVVDEIEINVQKYKIREIQILDDNFAFNREHAISICREIRKRNLNIQFWFPTGIREDNLDEEMLIELRQTGCYALSFGLESGSQKVLGLMRKNKTVAEMKEKVLLAKKHGFKVTAGFLFGTPGETLADMEQTIEFACSLPLDSLNFQIVSPYPGTEVREIAERNGYLIHSDWEKYDTTWAPLESAIETEDFTVADLRRVQSRAYRRYYLRPSMILKSLPNMLSWEKFKKYVSYSRKYI